MNRTPSTNRGRSTRLLGGLLVALALVTGLVVAPSAHPGAAEAIPAPVIGKQAKFMVVGGTTNKQLVVLKVLPNGKLRKVHDYTTGLGVFSVKAAQDGKTIFVSHLVDSAISVYRISDTGTLRRIQFARVPGLPLTVEPSHDSKYLYVTMSGVPGQLATYRITDSGRIVPTGHSVSMILGTLAPMVSVDPNNKYVRVASAFEMAIKSYRVGPGGRLSPLNTVLAGIVPVNGNTTPDGRFYYIAHEQSMNVVGYRILRDGNLAYMGQWFSGPISHEVQFTERGHRAYVPNAGTGNVTGWFVHRNGNLTPLPGSPYSTGIGTMPALAVLNPNGRFLYAVDVMTPTRGTTHVQTFYIRDNGSLVLIDTTDMGMQTVDGPVAALTT
ncbi:hypothetical protein [Gordonia sp. (in: high G+C Gram-positive bacteria)]|uniref:hypothetical protein n=1 Tax=Gordonia sp. (in: high G+C Gram-positive bacteria) TaxID=84139 RepID=UPI0039E4B8AF